MLGVQQQEPRRNNKTRVTVVLNITENLSKCAEHQENTTLQAFSRNT